MEALRSSGRGLSVSGSGVARSRQRVEIEPVFGRAPGADGLHDAASGDVPVPVPDLDVDLAGVGPGGEQHWRLLATAFPAVRRRGDAKRARLGVRCGGVMARRRHGRWSLPRGSRLLIVHVMSQWADQNIEQMF